MGGALIAFGEGWIGVKMFSAAGDLRGSGSMRVSLLDGAVNDLVGRMTNDRAFFSALNSRSSNNQGERQELATLPTCVTYLPLSMFGCTPVADLTKSQKLKLNRV